MRKTTSGAFASLLMLTACGQLGNNSNSVIDGSNLTQYSVPDGTPEGATAVMLSGNSISDCTSVDGNGDGSGDGMVWGYDGDGDLLAIIPGDMADIYADGSYICVISGGAPMGYVSITDASQIGTDCNDADAAIGATGTYYADADGDTFGDASDWTDSCTMPSGYVTDNTDCDDGEALSFPGNPEVCDGIDNDCANGIDDGLLTNYYVDSDGDTYGAGPAVPMCTVPTSGYSLTDDDCNDVGSPDINPGAKETCNGIDDNCDDATDEGVQLTLYPDADSDGFGNDAATATMACSVTAGFVQNDNTDCDDTDTDVNTSADEVCDTIDNDCDNLIDDLDLDVTDQEAWYVDADHDTYGIVAGSIMACEMPTSGYAAVSTDCDDTDANTHPLAFELCDSKDNDCDLSVDDGVATQTWYPDADSDTYGNPSGTPTMLCSQPSGYVADFTDCDDSDIDVNPGAAEVILNGIDDDCNVATPMAGTTSNEEVCVTPTVSTVSWDLWLRDGTTMSGSDPSWTTAKDSGMGELCANFDLVDGDTLYVNGAFNSGTYWLFMNVSNEASSTANDLDIDVTRVEYDATTGASDGQWVIDLE